MEENFLPKPTYFEGEEIQQVIHMAPYRARVPKYFGLLGFLLLFLTVFGFAYVSLNTPKGDAAALSFEREQVLGNIEMICWLGMVGAAFLFFKAVQSALAYQQWQFITTDKRIIITTPDPDREWFADSIYLKNDTIKVLDTNFSKNPIWAPFQIMTGARDVILSTGAYAFMEKGAKVKDGIRFPDVTPQDIKLLEKLVFGGKK
ncbi:MAG TPA: hypothetical protein PKH77_02390 [Anaerolineae bacterium]|nr:hypothetical protein [Anaerolineae bacterium]